MPEPFKNLFNPEMIALMGFHFRRVWGEFDERGFVKQATSGLENLELKERSDQIKRALEAYLPKKFSEASPILVASLHPEDCVDLSGTSMDKNGIRGWAVMPMTEYVGEHGTEDFVLGMAVQKELTKRSSSEFGIRHFIIKDLKRALAIMSKWASDPNYHVRRLVSEGSRPRLPWAMRLPSLMDDPAPLVPILEKLKDDPKAYVRRSVANNLNDIAKDHPDMVAEIVGRWLRDASPERKKLVRHACRSQIKAGHRATLEALGYGRPEVTLAGLKVLTPVVRFGGALRFEISLRSDAKEDQNLILDYVIHHQKANGKTSPKVFKWKNLKLKAGAVHAAERKHPMRPITTRVYHSGAHRVEIKVNGESLGTAAFELEMP